VPYFTLFGFPEAWAWSLMPVVESVDITLGVLALIAPTPAALLYMACWGLFTASLRPLAGEGGWEWLERAYNFGVPCLMFCVHGVGTTAGSWCVVLTEVPRLTVARAHTAQWALRNRGREPLPAPRPSAAERRRVQHGPPASGQS
jgi:hypothetical protein